MTGFGQCLYDDGQVQICVELRTLNSKFLDLNLRLPKLFSDRELEVRNLISEKLERGKVSLSIDYQQYGDAQVKQSYNENLFAAYYQQLKKLADKVSASHEPLFQLALAAPDVIENKLKEESNDETWKKVKECILTAVQKCEAFRVAEGKTLGHMLKECCGLISLGLNKINDLDPVRVTRIREKLRDNVVAFFGEEGFDTNRLEQEIIYYIEKLDINEEKVRLGTHLNYFIEVLNESTSNGKKLSFISQEIGREINTIGSKANDAEIQKVVVSMKEELEKIKEQINNVL